ncbi:MAG: DUF4404 family protein [Kangiellaceae bacterium]|nr:DUF4404 family protein [Kangiellaceae bacterium]
MTQKDTQLSIEALSEQLYQVLHEQESLSEHDVEALARLELMIETKLFMEDSRENPEEYLLERFQSRLLNFEEEHPSLSAIIRRISNSLSNIGV